MTWALQDAKNKFSAVAETAARGEPQVVTRHGHPLVVVISYETYRDRISEEPKKSIAEAFMGCPVSVDLDTLVPSRKTRTGRSHPVKLFAEDGQ